MRKFLRFLLIILIPLILLLVFLGRSRYVLNLALEKLAEEVKEKSGAILDFEEASGGLIGGVSIRKTTLLPPPDSPLPLVSMSDARIKLYPDLHVGELSIELLADSISIEKPSFPPVRVSRPAAKLLYGSASGKLSSVTLSGLLGVEQFLASPVPFSLELGARTVTFALENAAGISLEKFLLIAGPLKIKIEEYGLQLRPTGSKTIILEGSLAGGKLSGSFTINEEKNTLNGNLRSSGASLASASSFEMGTPYLIEGLHDIQIWVNASLSNPSSYICSLEIKNKGPGKIFALGDTGYTDLSYGPTVEELGLSPELAAKYEYFYLKANFQKSIIDIVKLEISSPDYRAGAGGRISSNTDVDATFKIWLPSHTLSKNKLGLKFKEDSFEIRGKVSGQLPDPCIYYDFDKKTLVNGTTRALFDKLKNLCNPNSSEH